MHHERPHIAGSSLLGAAHAWQRMLTVDSRNSSAMVGMSVIALASGQFDAAVAMAQAVIDLQPDSVLGWVAAGQAFKAQGRMEDSEAAYAHSLRLNATNELARLGLGELKLAMGKPKAAIVEFERALQSSPALAGAHLGMGRALAMLERFDDALHEYERVLALKPHLPEAHFAAGFALNRLGRTKEAEARYRRALVERPNFAAAWLNLGQLLREQGREAYAEAALMRAVELRPDMIAGWIGLGLLECDLKHPEKAEECLRKALALNPEQVETLIAWCQFCTAENDRAGAWSWLDRALALAPDHAEANNMHGILLHNERRFDEAEAAFERAERLGHRAAASNRGNTLLDLGRMEEALAAHEKAIALDPTHPGARYNLALTRLRLGDWERGWPDYAARWHFREVHRAPRVFSQPRWRGEPIQGKRILLHAEQGLGDTIQFCRYATLVAARGAFVILQVQPAVECLLRSLAVVRSGQAVTALLGATPPAFDLECPLMSLPAIFGTTVDTTPWTGAYVGAAPGRHGKNRMKSTSCPLRVGLAWAGNPRYKGDRDRSMRLDQLLPLLLLADITWVSLQKGRAAEQLAALPAAIQIIDGSSCDEDLAQTAQLISTLDLVIATDTCIAHLAGAMATPVWILLPHLSDWRWMQGVETSPWYPTARLFRQRFPGDWTGVVSQVPALIQGELQRFRERYAGATPGFTSAGATARSARTRLIMPK